MKTKEDLICLSHLRWNFVYQRPQHLMSRFAGYYRVFFMEEPVMDTQKGYLDVQVRAAGPDNNTRIWIVVPHIPAGLSSDQRLEILHVLLAGFFVEYEISVYILWYYTPEALSFTSSLQPQAIIYDCMDELTLFKGASPQLCVLEAELFERADLVFTGGRSLYKAKQARHPNVHCFPSSIDMPHFEQARSNLPDP